ncbi:MAG TPA: hypothetical protein VMV72_01320 [Verrucomicrobiae bacterium]|nr:hypothetical protein [Verrucomicrobiae bacterium]
MKTPREILLNQHKSAEPRLDRMWTQKLVPALDGNATPVSRNVLFAAGWKMWQELILPSRRIWAGLACAWVVIAVMDLASSRTATEVARQTKPPSREEVRVLIEQRRMLTQLIGPPTEPAHSQKRTTPGPHSECAARTAAA